MLSSHLYSLDNQGRRSGQTEVIGGTSKTWSYGYDNLDRLVSSSDGTAETYSYDIFGNRRSKNKAGTTTVYLYDAAQQLSEIHDGSDTGTLTGAAVHDADGHLVKLCENGTVSKTTGDCSATGTGSTTLALVWDALDHLNTATRTGANAITESYAYDDSGRRIQKVSGTTTTSYLYDGDAIHAEWNGAINGNPTAVYVHGAVVDEPLLRLTGTTNGPGATQVAYLQDGLGSVIGTANASGTLTANQRFDAWGNKTTSSGTVPTYGYTGREPDATGLEFYRNRYYHPGLGRFVSRDPMGMADAVSPYAYVANNATNLIDPYGLLAQLTGTAPPEAYWGMTADASGWVHGALGAASFCPSLCGSAFSVVDAGVYGLEGDKVSAGISLGAAAVGIVSDAGAAKLLATGAKELAEGAIVAKSAIGATGKVGEDALKLMGGESQVYFKTSQGGRFVDQLVGDVANESKVGYQSLTPSISLQISKDAELLSGGTVKGVNWHFFQSPVTGMGGPSQPLLNTLQQNGINVIIH